jgi:hypothetical protein
MPNLGNILQNSLFYRVKNNNLKKKNSKKIWHLFLELVFCRPCPRTMVILQSMQLAFLKPFPHIILKV